MESVWMTGWMLRQLLVLLMGLYFIMRTSVAMDLYVPQNVIRCEDDADVDINCFPNHIHILNAFYGRDDLTTCTPSSLGSTDTMCATNAYGSPWNTAVFNALCNNQATCNFNMADLNLIASTNCDDVYKFLRVTYICINQGDPNPTPKPNVDNLTTTAAPQHLQLTDTCGCSIKGDPLLLNYKGQGLGIQVTASKVYYITVFNNTLGANCFFRVRGQFIPYSGTTVLFKVTLEVGSDKLVIQNFPSLTLTFDTGSPMTLGTGNTASTANDLISVTQTSATELTIVNGAVPSSSCPYQVNVEAGTAPAIAFLSIDMNKSIFGQGLWGLCGNCDPNNYSYMTINDTMSSYIAQFEE